MGMTIEELLFNEDGIEAIDERNFVKAYDLLDASERSKLTKLFYSENINPLNYMSRILMYYMDKNFNTKVITIPENIILIDQQAFFRCDNICQIAFSEGLTKIGPIAFSDCTSLEELIFPKSLELIADYAFIGCRNLREVHFEKEHLHYIDKQAFCSCSQLEMITYTGTIDEWRKIEIASDAFSFIKTKNVRCTDGIFSIYEDED